MQLERAGVFGLTKFGFLNQVPNNASLDLNLYTCVVKLIKCAIRHTIYAHMVQTQFPHRRFLMQTLISNNLFLHTYKPTTIGSRSGRYSVSQLGPVTYKNQSWRVRRHQSPELVIRADNCDLASLVDPTVIKLHVLFAFHFVCTHLRAVT